VPRYFGTKRPPGCSCYASITSARDCSVSSRSKEYRRRPSSPSRNSNSRSPSRGRLCAHHRGMDKGIRVGERFLGCAAGRMIPLMCPGSSADKALDAMGTRCGRGRSWWVNVHPKVSVAQVIARSDTCARGDPPALIRTPRTRRSRILRLRSLCACERQACGHVGAGKDYARSSASSRGLRKPRSNHGVKGRDDFRSSVIRVGWQDRATTRGVSTRLRIRGARPALRMQELPREVPSKNPSLTDRNASTMVITSIQSKSTRRLLSKSSRIPARRMV